ncbi:hypothetical protein SAVCW2_32540 [Streptomyces avermitilis]|uniref:Proline-rich protein n=1 Tax=Streptomyces avermitilis TaxID=33903 RepID=A0A499VXP4_STRAX|nr:hypothetical protein SAVMC3_53750 [Streptomyces avermitilis]GDY84055.1 hypothetical protein SAVCW2_32540 [Streptomyces avermitilis]
MRQWYEHELGWVTMPGLPLRLATGLRFDVLDVPAAAGFPALRHLGPATPVALQGDRMRLLVAAGSADELPGLLDWLEWGALPLDLTAIGTGGHIEAPRPSGLNGSRPLPLGRAGSQGAAVWLRPPSRGAKWKPRCRRCRPWGAMVMPPTSYDWWTRWRRNATGSGCGARALSRWPSRRPHEWTPELGHGR